MTSAADMRTETQLLYLAVDVGPSPESEHFSEQVGFLGTLQRYSRVLAEPAKGQSTSRLPYTQHDVDELIAALRNLELSVAQRNLLDELLDAAAVGSFVNPLAVWPEPDFQVVRTSMSSPWVTVLADLARNSPPIAYGLSAVFALHKLMDMVVKWQNHRQQLAERQQEPPRGRLHADLVSSLRQHEQAISSRPVPDVGRHEVVEAIMRLDHVLAAEMVDPDDARATGAG